MTASLDRLPITNRPRLDGWLLGALGVVLVGVALIAPAMTVKKNEYRIAHWLAASDLDPIEQGALMAGILRASRFAFGAALPDGRAGLLMLDPETAARHGLRVDPTISGHADHRPLRLLRLRADPDRRARDARFDPEAHLQAARQAFVDARDGMATRLRSFGPAADDPELAAVLAIMVLAHDQPTVVDLLDHGELGRLARAETDTRRETDLYRAPPLLWHLTQDARPADDDEHELLRQVRRTWISTRIYREILPQLQGRPDPTFFEYVNAYKGVLVEITGAAKWLLHLLLGGLAFVFARVVLGALGLSARNGAHWALVMAVALAVGVELADAIDIRQTGKRFDAIGSAIDAVVTVLLPIATWAWLRKRPTDA